MTREEIDELAPVDERAPRTTRVLPNPLVAARSMVLHASPGTPLTRARAASGSRTGSQTRRPTGSQGPSHHCHTTVRGSLCRSPTRRWMTMTIVRRSRVARIDAVVEIVGQGLSSPRSRTKTHRVR